MTRAVPIEGTFRRVLDHAHDGSVTVSHHWVPDKQQRRLTTGRWHRISHGDRHAYRVLRYDPNLKRDAAALTGEIELDWSAWLTLSDFAEDTPKRLDLRISRVRWWMLPQIMMAHPDPVQRLALRVSSVAFVLGLVGLVLGVAPLIG